MEAVVACNKHNMHSRWGRSMVIATEEEDQAKVCYEQVIEFEEGLVSLSHLLTRVIVFSLADARKLFEDVAEACGLPTKEELRENFLNTVTSGIDKMGKQIIEDLKKSR